METRRPNNCLICTTNSTVLSVGIMKSPIKWLSPHGSQGPDGPSKTETTSIVFHCAGSLIGIPTVCRIIPMTMT